MFKKRTIISIFITILVLVISNKYWLIFRPLFINLTIKGKGSCNIEVRLNRKNNDEYKKIKFENQFVNLSDNPIIKFYVKKARFPKRIRIILSDVSKDEIYTIQDVSVRKLKLNNFEKYSVKGAAVLDNKNELKIKAVSNNIAITYPDKLNVRTSIKFDFKIFIIILVLTYLLSYKLSSYAADFNTINKKSRIEIIFLSIFFISLFIPMSNINQEEISKRENRTLAKFKPLILENNEINFNFGKDFENWFGDRFYLRESFINSYYTNLSYFNSTYYEDKNTIYNKKADFAYNKNFNTVNMYLRKNIFTDEELNKIHNNIKKLNEYCNKNNVKLYIMLSNDKESIYPEFYPDYYKPVKSKSRLEQVKDILKTIPNINIISPTENLLKAKENGMIFEPYDTHLNIYGSYIEYNIITDTIKKDFSVAYKPKLQIFDIETGEYPLDSMPPKRYINKEYKYEKLKENEKFKSKVKNIIEYNNNCVFSNYINNYIKNEQKLVIIGDSFHFKYIRLLAESFYKTKSLFLGNGEQFILRDYVKYKLFNEKPDILIIESTERFLERLVNLDSFFDIFEAKYRE